MTPPALPRVRASEFSGRSWLNTGGRSLRLEDLRGKIVVLDFWTFCCINCLHVLDQLRELEERHRDTVVIIGVHSPKFEHEADPDALAAAVERYEVRHPVLDDAGLATWSAYAARAWPTLVVVDPEGYVVEQMAGEGHAAALEALIDDLVVTHEAKGTLHRGDGPYVPPSPEPSTLRFPAKAIALPNGNLLVADAGHHSLAELAGDGQTLVRRIGSGQRGFIDGGPQEARFSEPNGLCLVPSELRPWLEYDVVVADTVNHALRGVRLDDGSVRTVAGTGEQFMVGAVDNGDQQIPYEPGSHWAPLSIKLSSPWDIAWSRKYGGFIVAMAGTHSVWEFDGEQGSMTQIAGTMNEGREDGPALSAWFAQPSGLAVDADGRVWVADSETSSVRVLTPPTAPLVSVDGAAGDGAVGDVAADGPTVRTAAGQGLFDFGHVDGPADRALLQHPLDVAVLPDGSIAIADTYNGAIRRYSMPSDYRVPDDEPGPSQERGPSIAGEVTTLAAGLAEPSGIVVMVDGHPWTPETPEEDPDGSDPGAARTVELIVVESAAHRLTRVRLPGTLSGQLLDHGARRTQRPATEIGAGPLRLEIPFTVPAGQKLDDTFGSPIHLEVTATPVDLLLEGAGAGNALSRDLVINPEITEGVLHVTAKAASCDIAPDGMEDEVFPSCHLAQQDWGVPVRVVTDAPNSSLTLPLRG